MCDTNWKFRNNPRRISFHAVKTQKKSSAGVKHRTQNKQFSQFLKWTRKRREILRFATFILKYVPVISSSFSVSKSGNGWKMVSCYLNANYHKLKVDKEISDFTAAPNLLLRHFFMGITQVLYFPKKAKISVLYLRRSQNFAISRSHISWRQITARKQVSLAFIPPEGSFGFVNIAQRVKSIIWHISHCFRFFVGVLFIFLRVHLMVHLSAICAICINRPRINKRPNILPCFQSVV